MSWLGERAGIVVPAKVIALVIGQTLMEIAASTIGTAVLGAEDDRRRLRPQASVRAVGRAVWKCPFQTGASKQGFPDPPFHGLYHA